MNDCLSFKIFGSKRLHNHVLNMHVKSRLFMIVWDETA